MRRISILCLELCLAMGIIGCGSVVGPNWLHPGSASDQQRRAKRYDPYPETDIGPTATNVRPREFEKPIAEPSQARWTLNHWEP